MNGSSLTSIYPGQSTRGLSISRKTGMGYLTQDNLNVLASVRDGLWYATFPRICSPFGGLYLLQVFEQFSWNSSNFLHTVSMHRQVLPSNSFEMTCSSGLSI